MHHALAALHAKTKHSFKRSIQFDDNSHDLLIERAVQTIFDGRMSPPLLQLKDIALTFGGTPLLTAAELSVSAGERVCLVGRNGSGKSTLLKIAAGGVTPDRGSVFVQPGASLRYLAQEPDFGDAVTTLAYVEAGLGPHDGPHQARQILDALGLTGSE